MVATCTQLFKKQAQTAVGQTRLVHILVICIVGQVTKEPLCLQSSLDFKILEVRKNNLAAFVCHLWKTERFGYFIECIRKLLVKRLLVKVKKVLVTQRDI